jgi:cold shock CspA family protein
MNETRTQEKCIFCKKYHRYVLYKFKKYVQTDTLDPSKMIGFVRLVEDELLKCRWNEMYCIVSIMIDIYRIPKTVTDIDFFEALRELRTSIIKEPKIIKIQKCSKNLTSKLSKTMQEHNLGRTWSKNSENLKILNDEIDKLEDILDEIDKLEDVTEGSNEKTDIQTSLKNYVLFRLMSFFEYKISVSIKEAMDGDNDDPNTYGKEIIGEGKGLVYQLDRWVRIILSDFIHRNNKKFKIKPNASFMTFFNQVIEIKSPDLKNYFQTYCNGSWTDLIKKLGDTRNDMTHDLGNATFSIVELRHVQNLMQIFCYSFERTLDSLMEQIGTSNTDSELGKEFEESSNKLSELNAGFVSAENFSNLINKIFDNDFRIVGTETGTVGWFSEEKKMGTIIAKNNSRIHFYKKEVKGIITVGAKVTYFIGKNAKGPTATTIEIVQ